MCYQLALKSFTDEEKLPSIQWTSFNFNSNIYYPIYPLIAHKRVYFRALESDFTRFTLRCDKTRVFGLALGWQTPLAADWNGIIILHST